MDALDSIFIGDIMAIIFEYLEIDHTTLLVEYARTKGNGMRLLNGQKINSVCFDNAQIKNSSIDMICTMSTFLKTQIMFCQLNTKYFNTTLNGTCFLDNKHSAIFFQHTQLNDVSFVGLREPRSGTIYFLNGKFQSIIIWKPEYIIDLLVW